jgi:hypothetical protein
MTVAVVPGRKVVRARKAVLASELGGAEESKARGVLALRVSLLVQAQPNYSSAHSLGIGPSAC